MLGEVGGWRPGSIKNSQRHQELREVWTDSPLEPSKEHGPADTPSLVFSSPEL